MFSKWVRIFLLGCIYISIFVLIPTTCILISMHQSIFKPYHTLEALEGTGIYDELHQVLPGALQDSKELSDVTTDPDLNTIFKNVLNKKLTINRIEEMAVFIEKDTWDYILGEDDDLEPLHVEDIKSAFLADARHSDRMQNKTIFAEKFIDEVDWSAIMNVKKKTLDQVKTYYNRLNALILWNSLMLFILIGFSFLLRFDTTQNMQWLSGVWVASGISLTVSAVILQIVGVDWMYANLKLKGDFSPLTDNLRNGADQVFVDFLSVIIAFSGFAMFVGISLFSIVYYKTKQQERNI